MPNFEYKVKAFDRIVIEGYKEHPDLGRVSPDGMLYFHNIPKNASSFMSGMLDSFGWSKVTSSHQVPQSIDGSRGICFLPDPIQRWISGITEFLSQVYSDEDIDRYSEIIFKLVKKNPDLDAHTVPQASYLTGYDLGWFDFLFIHEIKGVNASMVNYLSLRGWKEDFTNYERENMTWGNPFKMKIREMIKQKLKSDEAFTKAIKDYYSVDYGLIDWVGRNQKWIPSI